MLPDEEYYETNFFVYYPDNEPGDRLLVVGLMYGDIFADHLLEGSSKSYNAWRRLIKQIERTKKLYEAQRDTH